MEYHRLNILGAVHIKADQSLAATAKILGTVLGGAVFREDPAGRFDEFPSYSTKAAGFSFALLGISAVEDQITDEPVVDYTLQIGLDYRSTAATEACDASTFFAELIANRSELTVILDPEE